MTVEKKTEVRHVRDTRGYDVYIGRAMPRFGLPRSKWANPFRARKGRYPCDGYLDRVIRTDLIARYRAWLLGQPDLVAALPELRGKVLGCWCKRYGNDWGPDIPCHGDVLADLANDSGKG